jgi:hypothetical protein
MDTPINNSLNKLNEQQQNHFKVHFQSNNSNNIFDGFTTQNLPKIVKN